MTVTQYQKKKKKKKSGGVLFKIRAKKRAQKKKVSCKYHYGVFLKKSLYIKFQKQTTAMETWTTTGK